MIKRVKHYFNQSYYLKIFVLKDFLLNNFEIYKVIISSSIGTKLIILEETIIYQINLLEYHILHPLEHQKHERIKLDFNLSGITVPFKNIKSCFYLKIVLIIFANF
jgi:hypothetical protein